jgi:AraC-like DNA-binding protein
VSPCFWRRSGLSVIVTPGNFRRQVSIISLAGRIVHNMMSKKVYGSSRTKVPLQARDPFRDALALARPQAVAPAPLHATAPWRAEFPSFPHIKLGVIVEGECWLCVDGLEPLFLSPGDFYLLGNPPPYGLGSSVEAARTRDANGALRKETSTIRPETSQGSVTYTCSVDFEFPDSNSLALFSSLPPAMVVKADDANGRVLWNIATLLVYEIETHKAGRSLVLEHLAQILLVHMLRLHADSSQEPLGWLALSADDGIGAALRAIHAEPRHRWTLDELANIAMMSRSTFASNFKERVGKPPSDYLIGWRMQLARAALRTEDSLTAIAGAIGYQSESAFSTAFRRVVGMSPRDFRFSLYDDSSESKV